MLTAQEFVARWGQPEAFVSYDPDVVRSLDVPEETKAFLIAPGMPSFVNDTFVIKDNRLPTLEAYERPGRGLALECRHLRVLGMHINRYGDSEASVLLDERKNGAIVKLQFDPSGELCPLFCNSTLRQFAEYELIFKEFSVWMREQEEFPEWVRCQTEAFASEASSAFVRKVEDHGRSVAVKLREVDPAVSDIVDRFWINSEDYDQTGREPCAWILRIKCLEDGWLTNYY